MAVAVCPSGGAAWSRVHRSRPRGDKAHAIDVNYDLHDAFNNDYNVNGRVDDHDDRASRHNDAVARLGPFDVERAGARLRVCHDAWLVIGDYNDNHSNLVT